jgi:hypothetical protein
LEARIYTNSEKFEVLGDTLISHLDIHQARTEAVQEEMKAKMDILQEKMEAAIHSIQSRVRGDHQTSGRRCRVVCRPKDAAPP